MKWTPSGEKLVSALLVSVCVSPCFVQADSPDNLKIVWARTVGEKTPVYSHRNTQSKIVKHYSHKHTVRIAGMETDEDGQSWYEVVWPFKGWLKATDAWFASKLGGYNPEKLSDPERLSLRIETDTGNYPAATIKMHGKPKTQSYRVDKSFGNVVVQTLRWKGMVIEYHNSYRQEEQAWIDGITLSEGAKVGFGPIHIGDSVEKLGVFGIEKPQSSSGEVSMADKIYRYVFTYKNGKINRMSYRFGVKGDFLPAQ